MKKAVLIVLAVLLFASCDPAQTFHIINDTEIDYTVSYIDSNSGDLNTQQIRSGETYSFYIMGLFPGMTLEEMKKFIGTRKFLKIETKDSGVIAEDEAAVELIKNSLQREENEWRFYCSSFKQD